MHCAKLDAKFRIGSEQINLGYIKAIYPFP